MGQVLNNYSQIKCCHKCEDRGIREVDGKDVRCHSVCQRYLSERANIDNKNEIERKAKNDKNCTFTKSKLDNMDKLKRRH